MAENTVSYPTRLTIDYPDRALNRLTFFFQNFHDHSHRHHYFFTHGSGAPGGNRQTAGAGERLPAQVLFFCRPS